MKVSDHIHLLSSGLCDSIYLDTSFQYLLRFFSRIMQLSTITRPFLKFSVSLILSIFQFLSTNRQLVHSLGPPA